MLTPERIKYIRNYLGRSQGAMANLVDTTSVTVGRWERGESKPSKPYRDRLEKLDTYVKTQEDATTKVEAEKETN